MLRKLIFSLLLLGLCAQVQAQSEEFGKWKELFNGKDLTGWTNAKPTSGNHAGPNRWKVENGTLTNGKGGQNDICTIEEFENFELELWYKFPKRKTPKYRGNSGIYLRGQVEVQLFDSYGIKKPRPVDAGSIYDAASASSCPQNPPGHWNKMRIINIGSRITVYHNGFLVQNNVYRKKNTPGEVKVHPITKRVLKNVKGPIMFQGDHSHVWYKNIRIRPICDMKNRWVPMFNGKDLTQFKTRGKHDINNLWKVDKEEAFFNDKVRSEGKDIWTKGSYRNFLAHYEYKVDKTIDGGNSGFYLRDQWEIQIYSTQNTLGKGGMHQDGALYSKKNPSRAARNRADQWNLMDVKVQGMKIWVWQNGQLIHDGVQLKSRTDSHGTPTLEVSSGPFKLQGDHGKVWFTNLYIKELPDN